MKELTLTNILSKLNIPNMLGMLNKLLPGVRKKDISLS